MLILKHEKLPHALPFTKPKPKKKTVNKKLPHSIDVHQLFKKGKQIP